VSALRLGQQSIEPGTHRLRIRTLGRHSAELLPRRRDVLQLGPAGRARLQVLFERLTFDVGLRVG
jgi:hypothetical protein